MSDETVADIRDMSALGLSHLDVIKNGQSAYLGDHQILTRLFTGQKIYVDSRDVSVAPALILDGIWEPETTQAFLGLLEPGDCLIDVGANFGYFGLIAGTVIDADRGGSIHLIEANPHLIPLLTKSLHVTGLLNRTTLTNCAISDRRQKVQLHLIEHLFGSAFLPKPGETIEEVIDEVVTIEAVSLDEFASERNLERVDVVKLDIEGSEDSAYRGMAGVIEQNRDNLRVFLEFAPVRYANPVELYELIAHDFANVAAIEEGSGRLAPIRTYRDLVEAAASGFAMLVASNRVLAP